MVPAGGDAKLAGAKGLKVLASGVFVGAKLSPAVSEVCYADGAATQVSGAQLPEDHANEALAPLRVDAHPALGSAPCVCDGGRC